MSAAYAAAVHEALPAAAVVYDRFHVSKLLGEAVDQVRRAEHKELSAAGDDRLKGSRYIWLWHPAELLSSLWYRLHWNKSVRIEDDEDRRTDHCS